jgi:predicted thioesterase
VSIEPGLEAFIEHTIAEADTATKIGSGDVDVLGTPAVVALCERAAVAAIASSIETGRTSVGTSITLDHVAPTAIGRRVVAHAQLESVDGRTLQFAIDASDASGPIARGTHTRVVVDRERFLTAAAERP